MFPAVNWWTIRIQFFKNKLTLALYCIFDIGWNNNIILQYKLFPQQVEFFSTVTGAESCLGRITTIQNGAAT